MKLDTRIKLDTVSHNTEGKRIKALIRMCNLWLMMPYILFWEKKKLIFQQFNGNIYSSTKIMFLLDESDYTEQLWFQYTWNFLLTK